jgi:hypothetical protein
MSKIIPVNAQASLIRGFWFIFKDEDRNIAVQGSSSGQERIFINGELVAKKRSFRLKSSHQFYFEGNTYEVFFNTKNILDYELECSLTKDDVIIEAFRLKYKRAPLFLSVAIGGLCGAVVSSIYVSLGLSFSASIALVIVACLLTPFIVNSIYGKSSFHIEKIQL